MNTCHRAWAKKSYSQAENRHDFRAHDSNQNREHNSDSGENHTQPSRLLLDLPHEAPGQQ